MRFLFSTNPQDGHFRPMVPLARALEAAGHAVVFATDAGWLVHVEAEGLAAIPAGRPHADAAAYLATFRDEILALPIEERRPHLFTHLFAEFQAPRKVSELIEAGRAWRADAIVWESCDLAGPIAAAVLGVPSINHSFGTMVTLASLERGAEAVAPLWHAEGLEPDPHAGAFRGLYLDLSPPSFSWERPLGNSLFLRPVGPAAQPLEWVTELNRPLVYATLGTVHNAPTLFRTLLGGLDSGVEAILTVGRNVEPRELGPIPVNVRVEQFVPQAQLLPVSDAVISHGGSGTTLAALAQGLPLVLVPQGADQFDNAARAERAGAAIVLRPGEVTAAAVRDAVRRVLNEPTFRAGAEAVRTEIEAMPDADEVSRDVEAYVRG